MEKYRASALLSDYSQGDWNVAESNLNYFVFTLSHTRNFAPLTPRVIHVCVFFITVASSRIASAKFLCVRSAKTQKRKICPALLFEIVWMVYRCRKLVATVLVINEIHITVIVKDLVFFLLRLFKVLENGSFTIFILDFRWDRSIDPIRVIKNILFWFQF